MHSNLCQLLNTDESVPLPPLSFSNSLRKDPAVYSEQQEFSASLTLLPQALSSSSLPVTSPSFAETMRPARSPAGESDWQTAGVVHDFNNQLSIILSHSSIALTKLPMDSPARHYVERAIRAARRAADLCGRLQVDLCRQQVELGLVDLNEVAAEVVELLEPQLAAVARVTMRLETDLELVIGEPFQLQRVVMNLLLNAADSIRNSPKPIEISTANLVVPESYHQQVPAGTYATLQVSDSGVGMDQEKLNRIFEPYYTTKPTGTGIGLSSSLAIVQAHSGVLRVFSTPGRGSIFQLLFPVEITN